MVRGADTAAPVSDPTAISLTRLLSHLERTLLSSEADPQLRRDRYERAKVGANLEYARSLLLRLEHDSAGIKVYSRKQSIQADLQSKRDLIKQLNQRLSELNQLDDSVDEAESDASSDTDEGALPSYAPAHQNTSDTIDTESAPGNEALQAAAANLTSTLRPRNPKPASAPNDTSTTTSASLFSGSRNPNADPTLVQTETLLSHNRSEQEDLTNALLGMAQALKQQSLTFQSSLEAEKPVLGAATEGLDKNTMGMEAAGRRMGTLRRMTEGRGWWGRMMMYAWIAGLWFLAFVIVFVLPKLRF